jgi:hypothetical protein
VIDLNHLEEKLQQRQRFLIRSEEAERIILDWQRYDLIYIYIEIHEEEEKSISIVKYCLYRYRWTPTQIRNAFFQKMGG